MSIINVASFFIGLFAVLMVGELFGTKFGNGPRKTR